ncbi:MAG TPA: 16S rRNA (guanine(527)-N(7))-methyltransferase RsmG [Gammaproteobacteria bacterium]|nr:16S rRNA (guanine(527)-N(7))-methyltransferase RsmG [Gammaproteobacteria bacterium]
MSHGASESGEPARRLERGIDTLGLPLTAGQRQRLLAYLALLRKWNRVYNLTAVREPADMVTRHLLDSLTALPHVHGPRLLDVGSGAGLPGIPLAIAQPALEVVVLDSVAKKTRFLNQAVAELGLGNVTVVSSRVELYRPQEGFHTITSRAMTTVAELLDLTRPLIRPGGQWLLLKARDPGQELRDLPHDCGVAGLHPVTVPGLRGQRHIIRIRQNPR